MFLKKYPIGASTWMFGDTPLSEIVACLADLELDGVEISAQQFLEPATAVALANRRLPILAITLHDASLASAVVQAAGKLAEPPILVVQNLANTRDGWVTAVRTIAQHAQTINLTVAIAIQNRYESPFFYTIAQGKQLLQELGQENVKLAPSVYHMNQEEQDAPGILRQLGSQLGLFYMSDSNRQAIGRGHLKLGGHLWALEEAGYSGPILLDCASPGGTPTHPNLDPLLLETFLRESKSWL